MTKLTNPKAFFDYLRGNKMLGPTLTQDEVSGTDAIVKAVGDADYPLSHAAYALATAYHETAHTMQPIKEYGGPTYFTRMYDVAGNRPKMCIAHGNTCAGDGPKYFGRGYVQLTWKCNYEKAGKKLGLDLCAHPDRALDPVVAAKIMTAGMAKGWFTGKSNSTYLPAKGPATHDQFTRARRIINGTDKAAMIADYAVQFQAGLQAGGWA